MPIIGGVGAPGGGGSGGLRLRRPVDVFTGASAAAAATARNTYFTTTAPTALTEFIADEGLAIILRVGTSDTFQTYIGGATYDADDWVNRTDAVQGATGATGNAGNDGARGSLWASGSQVPTDALFLAAAGVAAQRGDHWLRSSNDRVYSRGATADTWTQGANLTGGRGVAGNDGSDGADGTDGSDGTGIYASFSVNGSTSWHETPAADDEYIRFATGTSRPAENAASWGVAIKFVGEDGMGGGMGGGSGDDGASAWIGFSVNGTTGWTATAAATHRFIRFATGTTRPSEDSTDWGAAIPFVGADGADGDDGADGARGAAGSDGNDGADGDSVEIEFSANGSSWHASVASSDTHIRFRVGTGAWQAKRFVGRDGARGSQWFVTTQATPQAQTGQAQGDFQVVADGSVFTRTSTTWSATGLSIRGPAGADGTDGTDGRDGTGGGAFTGDASDIDADLDNDPPQGGTVQAWLSWLAGENAIGVTARTQLRTRLDALEHSAVRAAVDDWNDVTDHLAQYGNAGLLLATSAWTTVDAAAQIWQNSPTSPGSATYYAIAQIPAEFDIERFRVQWDITGNGVYNFSVPNVQNRWAEFTGTVENGDPNAKYYVLVDRATGNTQYRAVLPNNGSLNLQHNDGTPASVPIPDDTITPAMLDADDTTKQAAFRTRLGVTNSAALTDDSVEPSHLNADSDEQKAAFRTRLGVTNSGGSGTQVAANPAGSDGDDLTRITIGGTNYNIPSGGGSSGGGGGAVQLTIIGSRYTFAAAGDTRWYATGISPGTISDDDLLYVRFVLLGEPQRYRPMRGATFNALPENTGGSAFNRNQTGLWQTKDAVNFANVYASVTSAGELLIASDSDWEQNDFVELYKLEGGGGGGAPAGETADIEVGEATDAAATTLLNGQTLTITLNQTFVWSAPRVARNAYRIIRMPAAARTLVSIIGEGGEGIEGWDKQSDNVTWAAGPVANNARDPETFTVRIT